MLLLFDIGNTNTHLGLADNRGILKQADIPTATWKNRDFDKLHRFIGKAKIDSAAICSVVPRVTPLVGRSVKKMFGCNAFELTSRGRLGIGIDYPKPESIGPDRLANAIAVQEEFGAPSLVVDFGTAVTFDVVNGKGNYIGGIIAPGLAVMTNYLHEKTALLPKIQIREIHAVVGKNTEEAMLIGAVHGYRGLIRELISELKKELKARRLPVVATGGYAELIAAGLPEITAVDPLLTLKGLKLAWERNRPRSVGGEKVCYLTEADL